MGLKLYIDEPSGKLAGIEDVDIHMATWIANTRLIVKKYPMDKILHWFDECVAEAADEQWFEKKWLKDKKFPKRDMNYKVKRKSAIKLNLKKQAIRKAINDNLKITEVAKDYGIIVKGKKALCPFHEDKDPSLSFCDEKNVFNCFGCNVKGDIITFIKKMEEKEDDNKTAS